MGLSQRVWKGSLGLVAVAIVAYVLGALTVSLRTFPYPQLLRPPFTALRAYQNRSATIASPLQSNQWFPARTPKTGVTRYSPDNTHGDYTFYAEQTTAARLVDMEGNVVHQWELPFRDVWPDPPHVDRLPPEDFIFWRAELFPNGDVIAIYTTLAGTPYGHGLVRIDQDSNVVWRFPDCTHHDFELQPDGSLWVLSHNFRDTSSEAIPGFPQFPPTILKDDLVHLSSDGKEIDRIDLLEAFADSKYREMLAMFDQQTNNPASGQTAWDVLHANAVTRIDNRFARHHDFAEPGQLMVSFRGFDAIALVDVKSERIVWASRGFWWNQHDPDPLPNGNIMVFDNHGYGGLGGHSRILEFNPADNSIAWSYSGDRNDPFWTRRRGSQQVLPNQNLLVTSTEAGRIFEITRRGQVVWEYFNPTRRTDADGTEYIGIVCSGRRYAADELTFLQD